MSRRPTWKTAPALEAALSAWFAAHGGVISRAQGERLGLTAGLSWRSGWRPEV
jgi:hypothetical protein